MGGYIRSFLNSLKEKEDDIGVPYTALKGDARSLDYSLYRVSGDVTLRTEKHVEKE